MPINLQLAANLNEFKKNLLLGTGLSDSQHDKYMLSYHYINYIKGMELIEQEIVPFYMPLINDSELRLYILNAVQTKHKLQFRFEKNNIIENSMEVKTVKKMFLSSKSRDKTRKAKNEIQFNPNG